MKKNPNRGFTLIELLLSAALLGFVLAVAAGMISGVIGSSISVGDGISQDGAVGEIEDVIAHDLAFVVAPRKDGGIQLRKEADGDSYFSFYSSCGAKTAWGDVPVTIHRVTYQVKRIPGGKALFRGEEPIAKTDGAVYDRPVLLADGVGSFVVDAFALRSWSSQWPAEKGGPMPDLFRVRLELGGRSGWTRTVYVESTPAIDVIVKPEAERRASGGAPSDTDASEGAGAANRGSRTREGSP